MSARRIHARAAAVAAAVIVLAALGAPAAFAHKDPPPKEPGTEAEPMPAGERDGSEITVTVPDKVALGDEFRIEARLTSDEGEPIADALVEFLSPASWGEEVEGEMVLGEARTDENGVAVLVTTLRREGDLEIHAEFAGDAHFSPVEADAEVDVVGDAQLYDPAVGVRVPGLGGWTVALVVAVVWSLYFVAGRRALAIARAARGPAAAPAAASWGRRAPAPGIPRRVFLGRIALPVGIQAAAASMGAGLVALVLRSPRTHTHLSRRPPSRYLRTPVSFVGHRAEMTELPPLLEREVSFARDVAPILMARGGPHVMLPASSPPPNNIRLDAYEHIMTKEGLVVPGKPMESMLLTVLVDPGMAMPPGLPPLPEAEIRVIASWVAQGAKNN